MMGVRLQNFVEGLIGSSPIWAGSMEIVINYLLWTSHGARTTFLPIFCFFMGLLVGVWLILLGVRHQKLHRRSRSLLLRKRGEREWHRLHQKLQAMGTLAGGVAHNFNNILYAMKGYIELSREDVAKDSLVYRNLGKALSAAERGQALVSDILASSRPHNMQRMNLVDMLQEAFQLLNPTLPEVVTLEKHIALSEAWICGDKGALEQVVVNMVNNAVDASGKKGVVRVSLQKDPTQYCLRIEDKGCGMDMATQRRIFEPFFTTKPVGSGTGLGLSMAHGIIEEHGGRIEVASQPGVGTTFTIMLPMIKGEGHGENSISRR